MSWMIPSGNPQALDGPQPQDLFPGGRCRRSRVAAQPRQIKHTIDLGQDMIIRDELSQRAGHEQFELRVDLVLSEPASRILHRIND